MSLDPFFSLSPLSPRAHTYDAANPNDPYAYASLYTFGGHAGSTSPRRLMDQHGDDQVLLAFDPVPQSDQTIASFADHLYRRCGVYVAFRGVHVSTVNQYLLVFRLARSVGSPIAQFFIGTDLVRAETLTVSPYDDIAILIDMPGDNVYVYATVRLASAGNYYAGFFFKGVDCYLL